MNAIRPVISGFSGAEDESWDLTRGRPDAARRGVLGTDTFLGAVCPSGMNPRSSKSRVTVGMLSIAHVNPSAIVCWCSTPLMALTLPTVHQSRARQRHANRHSSRVSASGLVLPAGLSAGRGARLDPAKSRRNNVATTPYTGSRHG